MMPAPAATSRAVHRTAQSNRYRIFAITCPFALLNKAGREWVTKAYADDPQAGVIGLVMEHLAVSLNQRQSLMAGRRRTCSPGSPGRNARSPRSVQSWTGCRGDCTRSAGPHSPSAATPAKLAAVAGGWKIKAAGTRQQMTAELQRDRMTRSRRTGVTSRRCRWVRCPHWRPRWMARSGTARAPPGGNCCATSVNSSPAPAASTRLPRTPQIRVWTSLRKR